MSSGRTRWVVGWAVIALAVLGGCGEDNGDEAAADPVTVSSPSDVAVVGLTEGRGVMVVDGGVLGSNGGQSTVWLADESGVNEVATLAYPLRSPEVWENADGTATVVGMECSGLVNDDNTPTCANAPIRMMRVAADGSTDEIETGVVTTSDIGFIAGPVADDGMVAVVFDTEAMAWRAWVVGADGEQHDAGTVTRPSICRVDETTYLVPDDIGKNAEDLMVRKVAGEALDPVGSFPRSDAAIAHLGPCRSDGSVPVMALAGGSAARLEASIDPVEAPTPVDYPPEVASGDMTDSGQRRFAWVAGEGRSWQLFEKGDTDWFEAASIDSVEAPRATAASGDLIVSIVHHDGAEVIDVLS